MHLHLRYPLNRTTPGLARRTVRDAVAQSGRDDVADTAEFLTSELVTNAVVHADDEPIEVLVDSEQDVRVSVCDPSPAPPVMRDADDDATSGRGIALMNTLASRWGIERRRQDGKCVWFELPSRRAGAVVRSGRHGAAALAQSVRSRAGAHHRAG